MVYFLSYTIVPHTDHRSTCNAVYVRSMLEKPAACISMNLAVILKSTNWLFVLYNEYDNLLSVTHKFSYPYNLPTNYAVHVMIEINKTHLAIL
jgi:hypothetical protein